MFETTKSESMFGFDLKDKIWSLVAAMLCFAAKALFVWLHWTPTVPPPMQGILTPEQLTDTIAAVPLLVAVALIFGWKRWLGRRRHVDGKARLDKVVIYVAELEGDDKKGSHRTNIIRSLQREMSDPIQILRSGMELRSDESGDPSEDATSAIRKARKYLSDKKADLMIWGQVLAGPPQVIELHFTSSAQEGADEARFSYDEKFRLAGDFGQELAIALAAAGAQQALPALNSGIYVADVLVPIAQKLGELSASPPAAMGPAERGLLLHSYALTEQAIGEERGDSDALERATKAFRKSLLEYNREDFPLEWAAIQNNLGVALAIRGGRENGTEFLQAAVQAFQSALEERTREREPLDWAATQNNLCNALSALGERERGTEHLQEAVRAYCVVLSAQSREHAPLDWARTENNLGATLAALGNREEGTESLKDAIQAFRAALEERTRQRVPLKWAMSQYNLGNALQALGLREGGTKQLERAVQAYGAALEERTRERAPLDWAATQNNLGNALAVLGERENRIERLEEAIQAYTAALEERTRDRVPLDWAATQNNLALALSILSEREGKADRMERAVLAYRAALEEKTRERAPFEWAGTQVNLGTACEVLGRLDEAVTAYTQALEVLTPEAHSEAHARVSGDLKRVLAELGRGNGVVEP